MGGFDDIDLDEIANSGAVIEATDLGKVVVDDNTDTPEPIVPKVEDNSNADGDDTVDPDAVDFDVLAGEDEVIEEDENEDGTGTKKAPSKSTATSSSQDKFTSLASAMREEGALGELDDEQFAEITNSAELITAMSKQAKDNAYADVLNEDQRQYLDAMEAGIPQAIYQEHKADVAQYENLTDERIKGSTALTQELIKRAYVADGLSPEKAGKFAARDMEGESSAEAGIEARNALVASENAKLTAEIESSRAKSADDAKNATANLAALKSKVNEATDVIPGVKVNATTRTKVFKSMTENVGGKGVSPVNALMSQYESDEGFKIKLHTLYTLTNGLKDFSKFTQSKNSDIAAKLDAKLKTTARVAGAPVDAAAGATTGNIQEALAHWEYGK